VYDVLWQRQTVIL